MRNFKYLKEKMEAIEILEKQEDFRKSLKEVQHLLTEFPYLTPLLVLKGELIQLLDEEDSNQWKLEDAKEALEQAVAIDEKSIDALLELAFYSYAVEDNNEIALHLFEKSINMSRKFLEEAYGGKCKCLFETNRKEEALKCVKEALRIFPESEKLKETEEDFKD
ncbi:MAG: hypothetical protein AB1414_16155 [bacterium]